MPRWPLSVRSPEVYWIKTCVLLTLFFFPSVIVLVSVQLVWCRLTETHETYTYDVEHILYYGEWAQSLRCSFYLWSHHTPGGAELQQVTAGKSWAFLVQLQSEWEEETLQLHQVRQRKILLYGPTHTQVVELCSSGSGSDCLFTLTVVGTGSASSCRFPLVLISVILQLIFLFNIFILIKHQPVEGSSHTLFWSCCTLFLLIDHLNTALFTALHFSDNFNYTLLLKI